MAIDLITIVRIAAVSISWAVALSVMVMFMVWMERKVSAHMQSRLGPMRVGRHGWLQLIADALKLLSKENVTPHAADKIVFFLAPVLIIAVAIASYVVIPVGKNLIAQDLNIGILYIFAISSLTVISIIMAGWGSNNKWALLGGMRSAAQ
ncbi:MAG: NADH-quinone oxidoreductase subunit H, partial [Candidatus Omnitrophica bacterium]|nr:NADH-quinone oxidoreductase subunit H [Candidatus Omnitrophota bacterium]